MELPEKWYTNTHQDVIDWARENIVRRVFDSSWDAKALLSDRPSPFVYLGYDSGEDYLDGYTEAHSFDEHTYITLQQFHDMVIGTKNNSSFQIF